MPQAGLRIAKQTREWIPSRSAKSRHLHLHHFRQSAEGVGVAEQFALFAERENSVGGDCLTDRRHASRIVHELLLRKVQAREHLGQHRLFHCQHIRAGDQIRYRRHAVIVALEFVKDRLDFAHAPVRFNLLLE